MIDLKLYHDKVIAADAEVKEIAGQIDGFIRSETEEGNAKALELQPSLDAAQKKHDEALKLYNSLTAAGKPSNVAQNFVPVSTTSTDQEAPEIPAGTMKLADFQSKTPAERMAFVKSGGVVED